MRTYEPMVNAVLNVAEQLARLAEATRGLLYGLKYSKADGMSIAEAIEVAGKSVGSAISESVGELKTSLEWAAELTQKSE